MNINTIELFNVEMLSHINNIKEKEVKILFALNDLLEQNDNSNQDFVKSSLEFLKEHYGLSKSVWNVLLKLHDEVPDFLIKLSEFKEFKYGYPRRATIEDAENAEDKEEYPEHLNRKSNSLRESQIKILFNLINELSKNFTSNDVTNMISNFVKEFDNGKNSYSFDAVKELHKNNFNNVNFQSWKIEYLVNLINNIRKIDGHLRSFNLLEIENNTTKYDYKKYKKGEKQEVIRRRYQFLFDKIGIKYEKDKEFSLLNKIKNTYMKYTSYPFVSYMGLMEIKEKKIFEEDKEIISILLNRFNKSKKISDIKMKVAIECIKLFKKYPDVIKGMEKFSIMSDYLVMSEDFAKKMDENPLSEFSLDNILMWSNQWHKNGESRGKKEEFYDFKIDMKLNDYYFEQIKDSHQLHEEGRSQKHCVYNYKKKCAEKETIIVSMKNSKGERISTLRLSSNNLMKFSLFKKNLSKWKLVENRKKMNKACSEEEQKLALIYFKQIQPILNQYKNEKF